MKIKKMRERSGYTFYEVDNTLLITTYTYNDEWGAEVYYPDKDGTYAFLKSKVTYKWRYREISPLSETDALRGAVKKWRRMYPLSP